MKEAGFAHYTYVFMIDSRMRNYFQYFHVYVYTKLRIFQIFPKIIIFIQKQLIPRKNADCEVFSTSDFYLFFDARAEIFWFHAEIFSREQS